MRGGEGRPACRPNRKEKWKRPGNCLHHSGELVSRRMSVVPSLCLSLSSSFLPGPGGRFFATLALAKECQKEAGVKCVAPPLVHGASSSGARD